MFRVHTADTLPTTHEVAWLWEGLVAQGTLALLGGPGGVGKSTLVAALEVAVAAGLPFLDREVAQGDVLHLDYDTDPRLQGPWYARVAAGLGVNGEALRRIRYLEPENPSRGLGEEGLKALLEMARQGPALLVLDSWSALFPFVDPRRSDHVAEVMAYLKEIAKAGPAVVLLDHTPKPVQGLTALERGIAGSFYKLAGARSAYLLTRVPPRLTGGRDVLKLDTLKNNLAPLEDPLGIERIWTGLSGGSSCPPEEDLERHRMPALNYPHACPPSHPPDPRGGRPAPRAGDQPRGPLQGPAPGPGRPPGRPGLDRPPHRPPPGPGPHHPPPRPQAVAGKGNRGS
jgi:hypothetical protein